MGDTVQHGNRQDDQNRSWQHLNLSGQLGNPWPKGRQRGQNDQKQRRVLLVAVNMPGYYSLAVRILALVVAQNPALASQVDIRYVELDNNADMQGAASLLAAWQPECIAWTVNIWNRMQVELLLRKLRPLLPQALFLFGGQEVTNSAVDFLQLLPELDYLIEGEGELALVQLLQAWLASGPRTVRDPYAVSGLRFRRQGQSVLTRPAELVQDLDTLPSVILAGLVQPEQRNLLGVMLEGSRGCPNRCSFCFEGGQRGKVRSASVARLAQEAAHMAAQGAGYFHILDPILCNSNPARLRELSTVLEDLQKNNPRTVISVEIYAHQVSEELAACLQHCTIVDVGLQSMHAPTAQAIHRAWQPQRFKAGLARLRAAQVPFNIYLICGLPEETLATYLQGLISIMTEQPTRIFCNELCLLNGTELRHRALEYGYRFDQHPPYRAWANRWMNEAELLLAQAVSKVVEKYYNLTARAIHTKAPWLPVQAPNYGGLTRIALESPCSQQCPGCSRSALHKTYVPQDLGKMLDSLEDDDVEIVVGNGADRQLLIELVGHLQLYAPARLRLVAPPEFFADVAWVRNLVSRGVWHFCSFVWSQEKIDPASDSAAHSLQALAHLGQLYQLTGFARIRPFSDIVLLLPTAAQSFVQVGRGCTEEGAVATYCSWLRALAALQLTMLSVPGAVVDMPDPWQEQLAAAFAPLYRDLCWLRLPTDLLDKALAQCLPADSETQAQISQSLQALALTSTATNQPPCLQQDAAAAITRTKKSRP